MPSSWKTALHLSKRERALLVKAWGLLILYSWRQKFVPISRWQNVLGTPLPATDTPTPPIFLPRPELDTVDYYVVKGVRRASTLLPFTPTCLAQACAGQALLREAGQPGQVVIGLKKPPSDEKVWPAHAWLVSSSGILTGGSVVSDFVPTTVFSPSHAS